MEQVQALRRQQICIEGGTCDISPFRSKLTTSPSLTGSLPRPKTIGIDVAACLAASAATGVSCGDHGDLMTNQIGGERRQLIILVRRANIQYDVVPDDIACLGKTTAKSRKVESIRDPLSSTPTTGIAGCCARVANGNAVTLPTSVMKWRRLIASPRYRHLRQMRRSTQAIRTENCGLRNGVPKATLRCGILEPPMADKGQKPA